MLHDNHLVVKLGFDTVQNEPFWDSVTKTLNLTMKSPGSLVHSPVLGNSSAHSAGRAELVIFPKPKDALFTMRTSAFLPVRYPLSASESNEGDKLLILGSRPTRRQTLRFQKHILRTPGCPFFRCPMMGIFFHPSIQAWFRNEGEIRGK